ncbi:MAG TPA: DUF3467 domain-containing protein [Chloroflexi bacterium]|nr:DUF3467 domain-containing protein [Chloroflexota bacterium]
MTAQPKQPPRGGRIPIQLPADLRPSYANFALITNSRSEIVLDFAQIMPQVPQARVQARIIMTSLNAKLLHRALGEHLSRYENQFGEIVLPEGNSLADQLFRSPHDEPEGEA